MSYFPSGLTKLALLSTQVCPSTVFLTPTPKLVDYAITCPHLACYATLSKLYRLGKDLYVGCVGGAYRDIEFSVVELPGVMRQTVLVVGTALTPSRRVLLTDELLL